VNICISQYPSAWAASTLIILFVKNVEIFYMFSSQNKFFRKGTKESFGRFNIPFFNMESSNFINYATAMH
jgi:hypothetical protein